MKHKLIIPILKGICVILMTGIIAYVLLLLLMFLM